MVAGRPPVSIKVLQANGKKHLTKAEIEKRTTTEQSLKPKKNKVKCPGWLDDIAVEEWQRIIRELKRLELVTNIDVAALSICCDAYSKYVKATMAINKSSLIITHTNKGGNKDVIQNPLINVATKYSEIYKKYCGDFGMTPSSRIKLSINKGVNEEEPESKWSKFGVVNGG